MASIQDKARITLQKLGCPKDRVGIIINNINTGEMNKILSSPDFAKSLIKDTRRFASPKVVPPDTGPKNP